MNAEKHESIESVERVLDSIQKLPSMPSVVMEILDSFSNENLNINTLATKVSSDLVIAARVLRVANSSFFGLSHQIGSISEAISILGFNNLRGIVTAASVINVFSATENGLDMQAFWRHSIATAVYAKVLAKHVGLNSETAFTAGLLHDIGKLVMSVYFPMTFSRINISEVRSTSDSLQAEKTAFGLDHAEIGGEVAKRWNFPVEIRDAISLHHTENSAEEERKLVHVIYIANLFANTLQNGAIQSEYADVLLVAVNVRLKINSLQLEALAKEAQQLYDGAVTLIAPN